MAVILVQHLFSRLIPGNGYVVHNRSQKPVLCPCGCQSKIETGNTSIGETTLVCLRPLILHEHFVQEICVRNYLWPFYVLNLVHELEVL